MRAPLPHTWSVALTKKCCCLRRSSLPSYVRSSGYSTLEIVSARCFAKIACTQSAALQTSTSKICTSIRGERSCRYPTLAVQGKIMRAAAQDALQTASKQQPRV